MVIMLNMEVVAAILLATNVFVSCCVCSTWWKS